MEGVDEAEAESFPRFAFESGGEQYMLATDLAKQMGKSLSHLFSLYPSLSRRKISAAERIYLSDLVRLPSSVCSIVRCADADEILANRAARNNIYAMTPEHLAVPRADKGYLFTESLHTLEMTPSEEATVTDLRKKYTGRHTKHSFNILKPAYGSMAKVLHPKTAATDLVPIRIDFEQGGIKLRDRFCWNLFDKAVTPSLYAVQICHDEEIPLQYASHIAKIIEEQIAKYSAIADVNLGNRLALIELNVELGTILLQDKFVWSHAESNMTPELFSEGLCADLGVGGEFVPLVAFAIREQLYEDRRKALQEDDAEVKAPLEISQLADCFHVAGEGTANDPDEWGPILTVQSWSQLEKSEKVASREARLRKRNRGDDGDAPTSSRRSGRARREISYAPTRERATSSLAASQNEAVIKVDPMQAVVRRAADDTFLKPSDRVGKMVRSRRGKPLKDDTVITNLLNGESDDGSLGKITSPARAASAPATRTPVTAVAVMQQMTPAAGQSATPSGAGHNGNAENLEMGGGGWRQVPRGCYKDNYLNRKLGRVGQKKSNWGPGSRSGPNSANATPNDS